jgi:hypothetical protein
MERISRCDECGRLLLRVSWSGVRTHMECKQRGALMRQGKRLQISDSRNFFPGNIVDRVVRDWLSGDPYANAGRMQLMVEPTIDRELERIKARGGSMKWKSEEDREIVLRDCIEAVTNLEPLLEQEVLPYEYDVDFRFQAPLAMPDLDGGIAYITLTGAMDIIVRTDDGKYRVWDVKMTRDDQYWRKTVGQLAFYDLACFALFEQETDKVGLLQPMCRQPVFEYALDDSRRSVILQQVIEMCQDIWMGDDEPTGSGYACTVCDVKHACTKFAPIPGSARRVSLI